MNKLQAETSLKKNQVKYAIKNNKMVIWEDKHNIELQAERDISFESILSVILDMAG